MKSCFAKNNIDRLITYVKPNILSWEIYPPCKQNAWRELVLDLYDVDVMFLKKNFINNAINAH